MAEKLFLNSEENFEDFCNNANDLMQSVTPEARFRWVNKAWLETLGYNEKQIANMTIFDIIHPDELEHCQQLFKKVMSEEDVGRITTAFVTKDGNKIIVEGEVNCAFSQGKPTYTRAIFRNITERKRMEDALQSEKERAEKYFDVAGVMLIVIGNDQKISLINEKGCQILGCSQEEIIGKNWFDNFLPERYRDEVKAVFSKLVAGDIEPVEYYENPVLNSSGEERIVAWHHTVLTDEQGNIIGTLGSGEDITERKKAEEELKESEERYRAMIDLGVSVGEAIILRQDTDQGEGIMGFVSDEWCRITGYPKEELLGISFFDLVHPKDREASQERYRKRMRGESLPGLFELCIIRKDGAEVPIELTSTYTPYKGSRANVAFVRDITERKKIEKERERLIKELEASLERIRTLSGLLPICAWCKKIRDDKGYWAAVEEYIGTHTEAKFSHGMCPDCQKKYAPE